MTDGASTASTRHVTSSFVGRQALLDELVGELARGPLLTVVGPPGVGKTRLALELAARARDDFAGGATVVRLAPVRVPDVVGAEVAAALGVSQAGKKAAWHEVAGRPMLLVLDNCEHLLDAAAAVVDELLRQLPDLRVLATSRAPLRVEGEALREVEPLGREEAVTLFVDRARAQVAGFAPQAAEREAIAGLCARLDGLPLAIELAAALIRALTPAQISERLDDRFRLLTWGSRTGEPHHRTLRSSIEWGYDLLDETQRVLLRRLSVFRGGFTLEAAEGVCADEDLPSGEVAGVLASLVDRSLVACAHGRAGGFMLLETIREFAEQRLDAAGEAGDLRLRHAGWYVALASGADAAMSTPAEQRWLEEFDGELDNFRAALETLLGPVRGAAPGSDATAGLELAGELGHYWWIRGHSAEGIGWLGKGLDELAGDGPADVEAKACYLLAVLLARETGNYMAGLAHIDRGLARARSDAGFRDSSVLAYLLTMRAKCANVEGDEQRALALVTEADALVGDGSSDPYGASFVAWTRGFVLREAGETEAARLATEQALRIQDASSGAGIVRAICCQTLGELAEERGDLDEARARYEASLEVRRALASNRVSLVQLSLPSVLVCVGRVAACQGDVEGAREVLREALPLAERVRDTQAADEGQRLLDDLSAEPVPACLTRVGAAWRVAFHDEETHLPDTKGMRQLRALVSCEGRAVSAVELAAADGAARDLGNAGPVLDAQAKAAYRRRLASLDAEIDEADAFCDPERATKARLEREALLAELARATGLGGRDRRAGDGAERARVNVTRTIRAAIDRITADCPRLGAHLDRSVRTGSVCVYEPAEPVTWQT